MKKSAKKFPGFVALRLPADLDDKVRYASHMSGQTMSEIIRWTLAQAWGITPEPRELQPQ